MADYIEREAVCYQLAKQATIDGQPRAIRRAGKIVANFPAADVAHVRHGQWLSMDSENVIAMDDDGCPVDSCRCSECGDWLTGSDEYAVRGRYCPNCGALMDKDGDGE